MKDIEIHGMYSNPDRIRQLIEYKQKLVLNMTKYERVFYEKLKQSSIVYSSGYINKVGNIIPQKIFTDSNVAYIVDFYVYGRGLVFEIDGKQHNEQKEYDRKRTEFLNSYFDLKVVRINNQDVLREDIIQFIQSCFKLKKPKATLFDGLPKKQIKDLKLKAYQDTKWIEECERKIEQSHYRGYLDKLKGSYD